MQKPNIVLINCDDLGYGDLGCYGSRLNKTPALDQLAAEGIRFTDFYVASPVCSPSRAALMTGCYPQRVGVVDVLFPGQAEGLHPDELTIADLLRQSGYRTKLIGKWHCGDQEPFLPTQHGFDEYYGLPYSNDMGLQGDDIPSHVPLPLMRDGEVIQQQPDQRGLTERYTEEAVRFIRDNRDAPFFLYLAHMYVHVPLFVPDRFLQQSENGGYGGAVACIDWVTRVIMRELRAAGLEQNTLVIFTSDNGSRARDEGGSNAPLRGTKGTTWEGGQRVPCIMRWPGRIREGEVCSALTTAMDICPTLAALGGAGQPTDRVIDGRDIRALMFSEPGASSPHDCFFYYRGYRLEALRRGRWKLHFWKQDKQQQALYDLESDIGETTDVYAEHPDVVAVLLEKAGACRADLGDAITGIDGTGTRPVGRVENPRPLTRYDPDHPYIVAEYDNADSPVMCG